MLSLGVILVILGIGSFLLPMVGMDLAFLDSIDAYQPWLGIIVAAVGLITILFGGRRRKAESQTVIVNDNTPPTSQDG